MDMLKFESEGLRVDAWLTLERSDRFGEFLYVVSADIGEPGGLTVVHEGNSSNDAQEEYEIQMAGRD